MTNSLLRSILEVFLEEFYPTHHVLNFWGDKHETLLEIIPNNYSTLTIQVRPTNPYILSTQWYLNKTECHTIQEVFDYIHLYLKTNK